MEERRKPVCVETVVECGAMKEEKGPTPAPDCPNCHGTGVDLGDMDGLARVVQACHCVKGGTFDERELWAVNVVLGWREERGNQGEAQ